MIIDIDVEYFSPAHVTQRQLDCHYRQGLLDCLNDFVNPGTVLAALCGDELASAYLQGVQVGIALLAE